MPVFEENLPLRRTNIFEDVINYPRSSVVPDAESFNIDDYDPAARMMQLYRPETSDIEKFRESIDQMPRRDAYTPNTTRGILGGLIALRGYEHGQQYLDRPYDMALGEWENRMRPIQSAAQLQHQGNINARSAAQNIVSQEQADRRFQQTVRHQTEQDRAARGRLEQGEDRIEIARAREEIAREVAKGGVLEIDDAGIPRMRYRDGSYRVVDGRYLSAEEKADLIKKRQLAVAQGRRDRLKEGYMPDPNNPGQFVKSVINLDTGEETPITTGAAKKPTAPLAPKDRPQLEDDRELSARAMMVKNARSDWSKYIKVTKGKFEGITKPGFFSGPTEAMYKEIFRAIYRREPTEIDMSAQEPTKTTTPNTTAVKTGGATKRVIGPNGQTGTVPATTTTLPQGWRFE